MSMPEQINFGLLFKNLGVGNIDGKLNNRILLDIMLPDVVVGAAVL